MQWVEQNHSRTRSGNYILGEYLEKDFNRTAVEEKSVNLYKYYLAPSTFNVYNTYISQFYEYCATKEKEFHPKQSNIIIVSFLQSLAETSNIPKSKLNCATAAINSLYDAFGIPSPARSDNVKHMVDALVRAFTKAPMKKSCVLLIRNFNDLFLSWPDNSELSIKDLQLKAIPLLSLSAMLIPSDIAPRSGTNKGNSKLIFLCGSSNFQL